MATHEPVLRALMIASQDGDAAAHKELLERLSRHLRAYYKNRLVRAGRDVGEAEDLVQEALMAIHTRRHTYDVGEPITPWVHAVARYKLVDHFRRTRTSWGQLPLDDASEIVAQDDHVTAESALDLDRLLRRLPERVRQAIQAVKIDGSSVAEVAARLGMSESAVKVSVHRGLKALASTIGPGRRP